MFSRTAQGSDQGADPNRDVKASVVAEDAGRDRKVAYGTRRVVMASLGILKEQKAGRKRIRAVALASILVFLLVFGPLIWWAVENLIAAEHLGDLACQFSLWVCILCPALLAAAVMAGWLRHRS
jgi:Na+-driven multidrug efflux pump